MDWNNDGLMDLICGNYYGKLFLFRRLADGTLTEEPELCLKDGSESYEMDNGFFSAPQFVDWDENGYLDLVVAHYYTSGTGKGRFSLYMNSNDYSDSPVFDAAVVEKIPNVSNRWRRGLEFADLDLDGDKDMIMGDENGFVYWSENIGANSSPQFDGIVKLCTQDSVEIDPGSRTREEVFDWNADNYPDLVISEKEGGIYVYLGVPSVEIETTSQALTNSGSLSLSILGNPVTGSTVFAEIASPNPGTAGCSLFDLNGRIVAHKILNVSHGFNSFDIENAGNATGVFILRVAIDEKYVSQRVVFTP